MYAYRLVSELLSTYSARLHALVNNETTGEDTYYGPLTGLLSGILRELRLPDDVREKPKEKREGGGLDRPDVALYDGSGDFIVVPVEVKLPNAEVWKYQLGGYPVIKKWLGYRDAKRRPGKPLSLDELEHLRSMIHRIAALLLLQPTLDDLYERASADAFTAEELGLRAAA